jgi:uncharacterized protein involved in exopolysaccharide biosynthesis
MSADESLPSAFGRPRPGDERIVYVMPSDCLVVPPGRSGSLRELTQRLWDGRWTIIGVTLLCALASVAYALMAQEWYRAETVLAPSDEKSMPDLLGSLGGLASLAGVSIGGGGSEEPVAVLRSREFTSKFIEDLSLTTVLFSRKWDAANQRWKPSDPEDWPDTRDAVTYFDRYIRSVSIDKKSGMVTLSIRWTDPNEAADWANKLVERLNARMRERALEESTRNVAYLQAEIARTGVVSLQQSIGRVLEGEMQRLMLAKGNPEFSFRVIDPATPPRRRSEPRRAFIVIATTLLGGAFAVAWVLAIPAFRGRQQVAS